MIMTTVPTCIPWLVTYYVLCEWTRYMYMMPEVPTCNRNINIVLDRPMCYPLTKLKRTNSIFKFRRDGFTIAVFALMKPEGMFAGGISRNVNANYKKISHICKHFVIKKTTYITNI